ncbi:MAG: DUF885 domain-containing protein [Thermoanaerobaculia bacterium]|nr:DUF885 domain-containing protein [Thermoanaerobaculia bacterium]
MLTALRRETLLPLLLLICLLWACESDPTDSTLRSSSAVVVEEVGEAWWQLLMAEEPWLQQMKGEKIRMPDLGPEHSRELVAEVRALLDRLDTVDESTLDHQDWLSLEILRWDVERAIEWHELAYRLPRFTPYMFSGHGIHGVFQQLRIETPDDAEEYLALTRDYARVVRDLLGIAEAQVENDWVVAAPALDQLAGMWAGFAESPNSIFRACDADTFSESVPQDFCDRLEALVRDEVTLVLREFADYLDGPYRAAAPPEVGLGRYPGGGEVYRALIRFFVTSDIDPRQAHELGLHMLETSQGRMAELRKQLGLPEDAATAHVLLKEDPRVLAQTPEEVGTRLMAYIERLRPRVSEAFDLMPKAPYGVQRLDPSLEGSKTFGHYNPPTPQEERGLYFFNGSRLEERPLLSAGSLIYHELIPGHHFQVALQKENESLPQWRRDAAFHSGFTEGWAEYGSSLMMEMGMYETPLDEYGRLASECFFGNRLVVDTGMHAMGWTLEQARETSRRNTLMSELEIETETLRYATDLQAQALAYALGAAKIRELREHAESELGDAFDLRAFHRAVLENGSVPLAVLEKHVQWWIDRHR